MQPPLVFSPDWKKLAFVSDVYPDCADEACNRKTREEAEKDPVKVHHLTRLHVPSLGRVARERASPRVRAPTSRRERVTDLTPGDFDSPPTQLRGRRHRVLAGRQGDRVRLEPRRQRQGGVHDEQRRLPVPVAGGAAKKLTPNPAAGLQPRVHARRQVDPRPRAAAADVRGAIAGTSTSTTGKTKAKRTVFETPGSVGRATSRLSPDGKTIYFTADERGQPTISSQCPSRAARRSWWRRAARSAACRRAPTSLVFIEATLTAPAEIFSFAFEAKRLACCDVARRPDARERAWLQGRRRFAAPESLTVPGAGGAPVQYWLIKPPHFDPAKKYPVVFLIHGGPQGDWGDGWSSRWNPSLWAAQGWVVVAPNPRGSTGFGQKFVDDISQDWGGKVMIDLDAVFDAVVKLPYVDAARQGDRRRQLRRLRGGLDHRPHGSLQGGRHATTASSTSSRCRWRPKSCGSRSGNSAARRGAAKRARSSSRSARRISTPPNIKTPTLVITNEQDFRVPVDQGLQLFTALRRNGVPSEALVFPDEGHWVLKPLNSKRWHEKVFAWMKK